MYGGKVKSATAEDVAMLLDGVRRVVVVPGYGMAVAQAQHAVRELFNMLEERGTEVEFAIHPVAGRMPGHMNVLLAEADIPYDKLKEMDEINPSFGQTDVVIVIGANDVVNPLANTDPKSPIAGMPILNVGEARTVVVVKRSLSPGFAGIPNPLFAADNTLMLFEDGKKAVVDIVAAMKEAACLDFGRIQVATPQSPELLIGPAHVSPDRRCIFHCQPVEIACSIHLESADSSY